MQLVYSLTIHLYGLAVRLVAFFGNSKAKLWIAGRKNWRNQLAALTEQKHRWVWFHCASLGEFEQGRPLIEKYKQLHPELKILLTFFSPSGYESKKNYSGADAVMYLPLDTVSNANQFIKILQPEKVFFIKYEFWFNFLIVLNERKIPVYLISTIFRDNQWFFRRGTGSFLKQLRLVTHYFVQDEHSANILKSKGINQVTVSGDTRFDRVISISKNPFSVIPIENWVKDAFVIVAGSTWEPDENILLEYLKKDTTGCKLIMVPHEVDRNHLDQLTSKLSKKKLLQRTQFLSASENLLDQHSNILIIDRIGLLSGMYRFANITYIGGGFGAGIHNTLEAAVYGKPVLFGPNYQKFNEAKALIKEGAAKSFKNQEEFEMIMQDLSLNKHHLEQTGQAAKKYVLDHAGATDAILKNL